MSALMVAAQGSECFVYAMACICTAAAVVLIFDIVQDWLG